MQAKIEWLVQGIARGTANCTESRYFTDVLFAVVMLSCPPICSDRVSLCLHTRLLSKPLHIHQRAAQISSILSLSCGRKEATLAVYLLLKASKAVRWLGKVSPHSRKLVLKRKDLKRSGLFLHPVLILLCAYAVFDTCGSPKPKQRCSLGRSTAPLQCSRCPQIRK